MKKIIIPAIIALASLTSCVGMLDKLPLNSYDVTSETAYDDAASYLRGLAYINSYYGFVSISDPGASDISVSDAGQSEFIRQWLVLNDLSTNALDIGWTNDSYIKEITNHSWTNADNNAIIAVYTRGMKAITLANEYLLQTTDEKLAARGHEDMKNDVHRYRAEARFHRAMFYYAMLDIFGNPPFALEENIGGNNLPKQIGRAALAEWIEGELKALAADGSDLAAKGAVPYPRPNKDAAKALLARLYLNWGVYTGTPRWADAKQAAADVIGNGYTLHPNYRELFMQDNGTTCSGDEFIFAFDYENTNARSWGGTTTLSSGAFNDGMNTFLAPYLGAQMDDPDNEGATKPAAYVSAETWNGYHIDPDFVTANFEMTGAAFTGTDCALGYNAAASDKRIMLCNMGAAAAAFDPDKSDTGWKCWKWLWMDSNNHVNTRGSKEVNDWKYSSADFAFFRLPEMYYIYAEADANLNGGTTTDATALGYIKQIRDRAGLATPASMTVADILKDKAVEYLWEGQRRQDEIRMGIFDADPNRSVYPILESDRSANPLLEQNPGYSGN